MPKRRFTVEDLLNRRHNRLHGIKRIKLYSDLLDVPPRRIPNASSPRPLSLLESLPHEILLHIVDLLTAEAYLAVKFVSKRMNAATRRQDGTPMEKLNDIFAESAYSALMVIIEAELSDGVKLDKLTCYGCGRVLGI